jgi:hypothetical protein
MSNFLWTEKGKNGYQHLVFFKAFRWIVHKGLPFVPFLLSLFQVLQKGLGEGSRELVFSECGGRVSEGSD